MPVGRRYELLDWAAQNNSIIIEDDYDSELRYFGKPVPALQGLDNRSCVVYLGTFSSTLFPAVKISYMVLPEKMAQIFRSIKHEYTQTCSKAEQLTLAFFMEDGHYYTESESSGVCIHRSFRRLCRHFPHTEAASLLR